MPRNGSGTYSLPSGNPVVTGTTISSTVHNNTMSDIATALTQSIASTGVTTPSANLPMGGFKFTGMGAGSANGDSVRYEQLQFLNSKGSDVASAATVNLDSATGEFVHITGTTTITAITLASGAYREVVFDGALTLTHNAATLILPGGANIQTAAGDRAIFRGDGTGNVRCIAYIRASEKGADIASASTVNLDSATGNYVTITGTTAITAITLAAGQERTVVFSGALTLTHNATSLILPSGANITTAAGDVAIFRGEGSGNVRCVSYTKASGAAVVSPASPGLSAPLAVLTPTAAANVDALSVFTPSYDNYLIIGQGLLPSANDALQMRFGAAGSADTGNNYYTGDAAATSTTAVSSISVTGGATQLSTGKGLSFVMHIMNANDATNAKAVFANMVMQTNATPTYLGRSEWGEYTAANAASGVRFFWNGGNNFQATGKIRIYGYNNS